MPLNRDGCCQPMASRVIQMSPAHRPVLQPTNTGKENYQHSVILPTHPDPKDSDSDPDEYKKKKRSVPNYVTNADASHPRRRARHQPPIPTPTVNLPSHVIARRNERERNRVRQVNESFAVLRSRIPDYLYETDPEDQAKTPRKKLSKVETLRLAVDYIQQLELLLDMKESGRGSPDDDRFQFFGSDTQGSSLRTDGESEPESDIMDLSSDRPYTASPIHKNEETAKSTANVKSETSLSLDSAKTEDTSDLDGYGRSDEDTGDSSPLPPISESFPDKSLAINYAQLYSAISAYTHHDLVNLSGKCD